MALLSPEKPVTRDSEDPGGSIFLPECLTPVPETIREIDAAKFGMYLGRGTFNAMTVQEMIAYGAQLDARRDALTINEA